MRTHTRALLDALYMVAEFITAASIIASPFVMGWVHYIWTGHL